MADCSVEVASAVAAIVSAIGGALAAVGAMRSASSARYAQEAIERSEKRAALRELVVSSNELEVEIQRAHSRATDLKTSYQTLFIFSGSSQHSNEALLRSALDEKMSSVEKMAGDVKQPSNDVTAFYDAALDDINKRQAQIQQALFSVRAIREDIEREHSSIDAQCAVYRKKVIQR